MDEKLQKIVDLINSKSFKEQETGKMMMRHLTLLEAWTVCNKTIDSRGVKDPKFLMGIFNPCTYPKKRDKGMISWAKVKVWIDLFPAQLADPVETRNWNVEPGTPCIVFKALNGTDDAGHKVLKTFRLEGRFQKKTKDYWIFDNFRIGKDTLMSITPAKK